MVASRQRKKNDTLTKSHTQADTRKGTVSVCEREEGCRRTPHPKHTTTFQEDVSIFCRLAIATDTKKGDPPPESRIRIGHTMRRSLAASLCLLLAAVGVVQAQVRYPASCEAPNTRAISDNFCLYEGDTERVVYTRPRYVEITPPDAFDAIAFSSSLVVPGGRTLFLDAMSFSPTDRPMATFDGNVTVRGGGTLAAIGTSWVSISGRLTLMADALLGVEAVRSPHERRIATSLLSANALSQIYAITRDGENAQYARLASTGSPVVVVGDGPYPTAYMGNMTQFGLRESQRHADCVGIAKDGSALVVGLAPGISCPVRTRQSPPPPPMTQPTPVPEPSPPPVIAEPEPKAASPPSNASSAPSPDHDAHYQHSGGGIGTATTVIIVMLVIVIVLCGVALLAGYLHGGVDNTMEAASQRFTDMEEGLRQTIDSLSEWLGPSNNGNYLPMEEIRQSDGDDADESVDLDTDSGEHGASDNDDAESSWGRGDFKDIDYMPDDPLI